MISAFGGWVMPHMSNNFWVLESLIFFVKIKNCFFVLMDSRSFKINDYLTKLLLATNYLPLWLLRDAAHEQQFLGCGV